MQIRFQREKNISVTFWSCERVRKKAFKSCVETDKTESSIFVLMSQSPWRYLLVCQTCRPSHLARLNLRKQQLTMTFVQVGICFFSACIWARASACTSSYAHMTVFPVRWTLSTSSFHLNWITTRFRSYELQPAYVQICLHAFLYVWLSAFLRNRQSQAAWVCPSSMYVWGNAVFVCRCRLYVLCRPRRALCYK